ncbi:MAG: GH92 family glycosyl hydrolase [Planctomycetota bacterium]
MHGRAEALRDLALLLALALVPGGCAGPDAGGQGEAATTVATPGADTFASGDDPARWVDPFIGTGGHGHTYPGAVRPFGMVQLSPDTRLTGWDGCSGYHFSDRVIYGFSHTHLSGTGASDLGDVLLMPTTGDGIPLDNGHGRPDGEGYKSRFRKQEERAEPGYYRVLLDDPGVEVELTSTPRVGVHRYRYPSGKPRNLVLDLVHRDEVLDASIQVVSSTEVRGERRSRHWARDQRLFFAMRFSAPLVGHGVSVDGETAAPERGYGLEHRSKKCKAWFRFGKGEAPLVVRVGLSATSVEGAVRNLEAECPDQGFDEVRRDARAAWNRELSKVTVAGTTEARLRTFTTALYHCMVAPCLFSDVDGRYRGMDGEVHESRGHDVYTVFSLWDTFRTLHPLLAIIDRERSEDFLRTFAAMYEDGGRLPVWELWGNETDCMIGHHAIPVIADCLAKGIGVDDLALYRTLTAAAVHSMELDQRGQAAYKRYGYIPSQLEPESVSKTLEYAYDDWCVAWLRRDPDEIEARLARAMAWHHLFDPDTGFLRAREQGGFKEPFDPREVNSDFTEANCWQYSFFVPHDVGGLIEAHGGDAGFVRALDALFEAPVATTGRNQADITGLIGQYAHGNEPSHHVAWLYPYAGEAWKSQRRVRQILDELYTDRPDGLCGNEDCGQMSAWYVCSALGFYPVCPGFEMRYVLGAPLFPAATIRLEDGSEVVIRAPGAARDHAYVRSVTVDGEPWSGVTLGHGLFKKDTEISVTLADEPTSFGHDKDDRPLQVPWRVVVPAPLVVAPGRVFGDRIEVALRSLEDGAALRWCLDRDLDDDGARPYVEPIVLDRSAVLHVQAVRADGKKSPVVDARFWKLPHDWKLSLKHLPAPYYSAGLREALIDGRRGTTEWRRGYWQGFRDDLEAVVDLGREQRVARVACRFLHDQRSWILPPRDLVVGLSRDGEHWTELEALRPDVDPMVEELSVVELGRAVDDVPARYVRLRARNFGRLPEGHVSAGQRAWLFADELTIEAR